MERLANMRRHSSRTSEALKEAGTASWEIVAPATIEN